MSDDDFERRIWDQEDDTSKLRGWWIIPMVVLGAASWAAILHFLWNLFTG